MQSSRLELLKLRITQAKSASVMTLRAPVVAVAELLVEILTDQEARLNADAAAIVTMGGVLDELVAKEIVPDPHLELARIESDLGQPIIIDPKAIAIAKKLIARDVVDVLGGDVELVAGEFLKLVNLEVPHE